VPAYLSSVKGLFGLGYCLIIPHESRCQDDLYDR
jgi:hypothetical protein